MRVLQAGWAASLVVDSGPPSDSLVLRKALIMEGMTTRESHKVLDGFLLKVVIDVHRVVIVRGLLVVMMMLRVLRNRACGVEHVTKLATKLANTDAVLIVVLRRRRWLGLRARCGCRGTGPWIRLR